MTKRRRIIIAGAAVAALAGTGAAVAVATDDDDGRERPITGTALDRAKAAALEHTGGGIVTGTETGDEESLYEVEVTKSDGTEVDVQLDESFDVVGAEADDDSGPDDE